MPILLNEGSMLREARGGVRGCWSVRACALGGSDGWVGRRRLEGRKLRRVEDERRRRQKAILMLELGLARRREGEAVSDGGVLAAQGDQRDEGERGTQSVTSFNEEGIDPSTNISDHDHATRPGRS